MFCKDCKNGNINMRKPVLLRIGCSSYEYAYSCDLCGRLHWSDGSLVLDRSGRKAFLDLETGEIINKEDNSP